MPAAGTWARTDGARGVSGGPSSRSQQGKKMKEYSSQRVRMFVAAQLSVKLERIYDTMDLLRDLGVDGDDANDFFNVALQNVFKAVYFVDMRSDADEPERRRERL